MRLSQLQRQRRDGPVAVSGRLMETAPGSYYWDGRVAASLELRCRRCLTRVPVVLDQRIRALFTEDDEAGDPAAYIIPHRAAQLDLRDAVREELLLAVPGYPVCRPDCRGICPQCGKDLNEGPCESRPVSKYKKLAWLGIGWSPRSRSSDSTTAISDSFSTRLVATCSSSRNAASAAF